METTALDLINLRRLPTGRRRFAVGQVKEVAQVQGDAELAALCDESLAHDTRTAELQAKRGEQLRRAAGAQPKRPSRAVGLDSQLDRALGGLDGKLASEAKAYSPGAPEVDQVEALRAFLFPVGVAGITRRSHVEELELTKGLLARADQRKDELGAYGATNVIARIASLVSELEAALKAEKNEPIAADDVRAATLKGNALVADIVVQILNKTRPEADASAMARRQALLRPILAQDAIMYEYNRQSRKALDVDPATAEEVETDEDG